MSTEDKWGLRQAFKKGQGKRGRPRIPYALRFLKPGTGEVHQASRQVSPRYLGFVTRLPAFSYLFKLRGEGVSQTKAHCCWHQ